LIRSNVGMVNAPVFPVPFFALRRQTGVRHEIGTAKH